MATIDLDPSEAASEAMQWLPRGAFLTVRHGHRVNTMTIGWGTFGVIWTRPVFMVAVRNTRHTFKLIERAPDYTVSVPTTTEAKGALAFCGTHSGKDWDKFAETGLSAITARAVASPLVDVEGIHYECRTLLREAMAPDLMAPELLSYYPEKDYHSLYFGEVVACYRGRPEEG